MTRIFIFFIMLLPLFSEAQSGITGRVIDKGNKKPVAHANVFLNNATIGSESLGDGTFELRNIKPGKYQLVVSIVGFETYHQNILINDGILRIPDIEINTKIIALNEVIIKVKSDPNRARNYEWFKENFLGNSEFSKECKILNPNVLDLNYDEATKTLTASSYDFLVIENNALGYKIKYLVTDFSFKNQSENEKEIFYEGSVLFEPMTGTLLQQSRWKNNRWMVYENSPMHFLRSALSDSLYEEGFKVQKLIIYDNPDRPSDSLINSRIKAYKGLSTLNFNQSDSLTYWLKKSKLHKKFTKLITLTKKDIIRSTDQHGQYALNPDTNRLFVAYNKAHNYHIKNWSYLYNANNNENTLIKFNSNKAYFYNNGVILDPYSVIYFGVWGMHRVAELLPINYEVR
jgi:hypothetical protein